MPTSEARRPQHSDAILLRIRRDLEAVAQACDARVSLVEVPPGPPVISTIGVELYDQKATPYGSLQEAAKVLEEHLGPEKLVVDVDPSVGDDQRSRRYDSSTSSSSRAGRGRPAVAFDWARVAVGVVSR